MSFWHSKIGKPIRDWWNLWTFRLRGFKHSLELMMSVTPDQLVDKATLHQREMVVRLSVALQPKKKEAIYTAEQVFEIPISSPEMESLQTCIRNLKNESFEFEGGDPFRHGIIRNSVILTLEEIESNEAIREVVAESFTVPSISASRLEFFMDYSTIFYKGFRGVKVHARIVDVS